MIRRGRLSARGKRFAIVVSRFNEIITRKLLAGALETLDQCGAREKDIEVVWVPGSLEVPQLVKKMAQRKKISAVVALGCVLRGQTRHFECVAQELTRGISQAALETGVPVATGVITADSFEQAMDRAGLKSGNKGSQAALAAVELADLTQQIIKKTKRGLTPLGQKGSDPFRV